jgi:hypothetical protein
MQGRGGLDIFEITQTAIPLKRLFYDMQYLTCYPIEYVKSIILS